MHVGRVAIKNYGAIHDLLFEPEKNNEGGLKPLAIVGKNGSGKTLLLSHLVDSLIEMKRKKYNKVKEVDETNFYRLGSKKYITTGQSYSYTHITFEDGEKEFKYVDLMANDLRLIKEKIETGDFDDVNLPNEKLEKDGFYKNVVGHSIEDEFDQNIILYFPVHRFYTPSWYNEENGEIGFKHTEKRKILGRSDKSLVKENMVKEIEKWILEILLDKFLYEESRREAVILNGTQSKRGIEVVSTEGKNTRLQHLLNRLLTTIYQVKYKDIEYARLGVSSKGDRRVSVIIKREKQESFEIAPTFSHLSSGEAMLIALFGTMLKEYDEISENSLNELKDVKGIVLIDELDLNLHIEFAKEILPELMLLFPNVQFIFTTHSPFLLLGMEETFKENWQIINLPEGNYINTDNFSEIREAYDIFLEGHNELEEAYESIKSKVEQANKPLVITEGKTDWKHFKKALQTFKEQGLFDAVDIEFHEFEDEITMSDSELHSLLTQFAKVENPRKIIGIFDRDEGQGKKISKEKIRSYGNNIYGISIPTPSFREYHTGISVEFLYEDEDLKREDSNGRRIYLSSEFNETTGRHKKDNDINIANVNAINNKTDREVEKVIDKNVFNKNGKSLALSKNDFARNIYEEQEGFLNMNLSGFEGVFELIQSI